MEVHLGYPKHPKRSEAKGNARNGTSRKTLKGAQNEGAKILVVRLLPSSTIGDSKTSI